MNSELLRQHKEFKKKAKCNPTVAKEMKKKLTSAIAQTTNGGNGSGDLFAGLAAVAGHEQHHVDNNGGSNSQANTGHYRFSLLSRILRHLKTRFQRGVLDALEIDEILEEIDQLDCLRATKNWLTKIGLVNHPKIEMIDNGKRYRFKPTYKLKDGKSLMRLLKQHDLKGLGGVLYEDVQESLPNCDKVLMKYSQDIIEIIRTHDKKKVLFYNDRTANLSFDEEFQKIWRSLNVDATNEIKIEEYLNKEGNGALQSGKVLEKPVNQQRKRPQKKRMSKKSTDNEHLGDILIDFSEDYVQD